MARVPTWTELRVDATRLEQLLRQCNGSIHSMLDSGIAELDRKIMLLYGESKGRRHGPIEDTRLVDLTGPNLVTDVPDFVVPTKLSRYSENISIRNTKSLENVQARNFKYPEIAPSRNARSPEVVSVASTRNLNAHYMVQDKAQQEFKPVVTSTYPKVVTSGIIKTPEVVIKEPQKNLNGYHSVEDRKELEFRPTSKPYQARNKKQPKVVHHEEPNFDELEHLKPLPYPLSHYFQRNRPELVMRADSRLIYLKNKSERRKQLASTRIINSLEQIRLSSRNSTNQLAKQARTKDYMAPKYQVQCRLSEHEMKRLTAKTYKRLPEVKRRRREEFSNHMKVQNYKNKLEYGRKLLENRRHGIINYPLRSSYDDRSITSSQSEYCLNGNERAADAFRPDPYY